MPQWYFEGLVVEGHESRECLHLMHVRPGNHWFRSRRRLGRSPVSLCVVFCSRADLWYVRAWQAFPFGHLSQCNSGSHARAFHAFASQGGETDPQKSMVRNRWSGFEPFDTVINALRDLCKVTRWHAFVPCIIIGVLCSCPGFDGAWMGAPPPVAKPP